MFKLALATALSLAALTGTAQADEVTDTINSALEAYNEGDIQYALEELEFAKQLMNAMKLEVLVGFLPEAPDGWTREDNTDMNAGLAFMGGGLGAEAEYSDGSQSFTLTITAGNPMIAAMAGMLGNAGAMGIPMVRVGREKFMNQDGELTGLSGTQVLIQADGAEVDTMVGILEMIDFKELGNFGG
ncbi:MAG: hypothetical protein GY945_11640 [Rhodobacteraceae bacterium]|nr:hypothetical protein [Paracoccaceae bacterium]